MWNIRSKYERVTEGDSTAVYPVDDRYYFYLLRRGVT